MKFSQASKRQEFHIDEVFSGYQLGQSFDPLDSPRKLIIFSCLENNESQFHIGLDYAIITSTSCETQTFLI
jgi:hypothetical protein